MRDTSFGMESSAQTLRGIAVREPADVQTDRLTQPDIPSLNALALRSLVSLFDEKEQLFSERVMLSRGCYRRDETSRKQTIIALLGLHRLVESGGTQPFDIAAIRDAAFQDRSWISSAGDVGLLTWFTAACLPDRLRVVLDEINFEEVLQTFEDGRQAQTTGLAWFLAGLAHAALARPEMRSGLTDVAVDTYRLLQDNQSHAGIFGHSGSMRLPLGILCSRFGTFSDQISAIYSLSMFAKAFKIEEPLGSALACASTICQFQGDLGQWWFLYDKSACRVVKRYPVLSSHQDGTAPCALLALGEATGRRFHNAIAKGLSWITGGNELGSDLRKLDQVFIWDSIEPVGRLAKYREAVLDFLIPSREAGADGLGVRCQARPEHFGWLLCAFGNLGLPKAASKVARQGS